MAGLVRPSYDPYAVARHWFLHCLLRLSVREDGTKKERRELQRELVRIRRAKYET